MPAGQPTKTDGPHAVEGDRSWITGDCGHSWWAVNVSSTLHNDGRGFIGRKCPECGERGPVKQGRPRAVCEEPGCGAVLSIYNRETDRCSVHRARRRTHGATTREVPPATMDGADSAPTVR